ncbi:MAG: hypothetical protein HRT53_20360 [Colwellia sp.]|nr:hypothetical protein [Colwellia sp.]
MSEVKIKPKFVIMLIAVAVIATLAYSFLPTDNSEHLQSSTEIKEKKPILKGNIQELKAPQNMSTQIIKNIKEPVQSLEIITDDEFTTISRLSDKAESVLKDAGVLPRDIVGANVVYLEFDLDSLRALEVGGTFDLEIPQTQEIFTAEVTGIEKFPNGDKNIVGTVIGQGGDFHTTVITVGKDAMYGQFTTISGNWVFESKDQYGWMASKRELYKSHVEFEAVPSGTTVSGADDPLAPKIKN